MKHHAIKMYERLEVYRHTFLTLKPHDISGQLCALTASLLLNRSLVVSV